MHFQRLRFRNLTDVKVKRKQANNDACQYCGTNVCGLPVIPWAELTNESRQEQCRRSGHKTYSKPYAVKLLLFSLWKMECVLLMWIMWISLNDIGEPSMSLHYSKPLSTNCPYVLNFLWSDFDLLPRKCSFFTSFKFSLWFNANYCGQINENDWWTVRKMKIKFIFFDFIFGLCLIKWHFIFSFIQLSWVNSWN